MSTTHESVRLLEPSDLLAMPDRKEYELVRGELREKKVSSLSSLVASELLGLLHAHAHAQTRKGVWIFGADCGYIIGPRTVRLPDVSVVRIDRLPADEIGSGWLEMAPDLAVEVVSPNDSAYEVDQKVDEMLDAGTRLLWVVNPARQSVRIHRADGSVSLLRGEDTLEGEDVLPGFRCVVKSLFPTMDPAKA